MAKPTQPGAATYSISALSAVEAEGNSGTTGYTFTITRTCGTGAATIDYTVAGTTVSGAQADDFAGGIWPEGTVSFAKGETSKVITIPVLGDTTVEGNESFTVTLSNPSQGKIGTATATGTIQNDDTAGPSITYITGVTTASDLSSYVGSSGQQNISADGQYVAFYSPAKNLVSGKTGHLEDIFVYDTVTKIMTNITNGGDGSSLTPSISADGQHVAFYSYAANLVSGQTDQNGGIMDVFVYDTVAKTMTNITDGGDSYSYAPSISADGQHVAFFSQATNLVSGQTDQNGGLLDVFVYDTAAKTMTNITDGGDSSSYRPSISSDGQHVAFESTATNLVSGQTDQNGWYDIFVYDTVAKTMTNITNGGDRGSSTPSISADGHYVAFYSNATNLVSGQTDENGTTQDVFVYDTVSKTMTNITNGGDGYSDTPSISADGQHVAFYSNATNLVSGQTDENGSTRDVFVYDTVAKTMTNITNGGNNGSATPSISPDGSSVVFNTLATNLDGGTHLSIGHQDIALWHV